MRKIILIVAVAVLIPLLVCNFAEAKRGPAPKVEPLVYKGVQFIAPNTHQKMGYVEAWDIETNQKVWEKKVYSVSINPIMEQDVQWVFISVLKIEDNKLIVSDERGKEYKVEIPKNILKESIQPLQLTIKSDKQVYEVGEEIKLIATIKNNSDKEMIVFWSDEPPAGASGGGGTNLILWLARLKHYQMHIKPKQSVDKLIIPGVGSGPTFILHYDSSGIPLDYKHKPDQEIFVGRLTSNTITIEVVEKGNIPKETSTQHPPKIIKRSEGQGDYVRDERSPVEACNLLLQEVRDGNPGMNCELINSGRIDSPENFKECVDGATVAGCFTCMFECK